MSNVIVTPDCEPTHHNPQQEYPSQTLDFTDFTTTPHHEPPIDWSEILQSVHGTDEWHKGVAFTCHLCERVMLLGLAETVEVGPGEKSLFEFNLLDTPRKLPTILLCKDLLDEAKLPDVRRDLKLAALGGVLAHEMAHFLLALNRSDDPEGMQAIYERTAKMPIRQKRNVLSSLNAHFIAKWMGCPLSTIHEHWAATNAAAARHELEAFTKRIDYAAMHDFKMRIVTKDTLKWLKKSARERNANEWLAATAGFLMFYRLNRGRGFVTKLLENFDGVAAWGDPGILNILKIAAGQPDAEAAAEELANRLLDSGGNEKGYWNEIPGLPLVTSRTLPRL